MKRKGEKQWKEEEVDCLEVDDDDEEEEISIFCFFASGLCGDGDVLLVLLSIEDDVDEREIGGVKQESGNIKFNCLDICSFWSFSLLLLFLFPA